MSLLLNGCGGGSDLTSNENGPTCSSSNSNPTYEGMSRCDARCAAERKICSREMQKWSRNMLVLIGLEQVSRRAAGPQHWNDLEKAIKVSTRRPKDFDLKTKEKESCLWCAGSNRPAGCASEVPNFKILMAESKLKSSGQSITGDYDFPDMSIGVPRFSDSSLRNVSAVVGDRSSPCSPGSMCSVKSFSSSTCKESSLNFENIFDPTKNLGNNTSEVNAGKTDRLEQNSRLAAALRLLPGLPLLSNSAFFGPTGLWMNSTPSSSLLADQQKANFEGLPSQRNASSTDNYGLGEEDFVQRFAQWQTQLMALNMMSGLLNNPDSSTHHFPAIHNEELNVNSSIAPIFGSPTTEESIPEAEGADEEEEDKPLDLSSGRNQTGQTKAKASNKIQDILRREIPVKLSAIKKTTKKLTQHLEVDTATAEWLSPESTLNKQPSSSSTTANPKLHLLGTKRNYTQADLDAAVLDIRMGRLGTRRASVVYGIPRSTLRNKIYKLEAAEDNGDGSSKRRRLNAYALRKKEKSSLQVLKRSAPKSLLNPDSQASPKKMGMKRIKLPCCSPATLDLMPSSQSPQNNLNEQAESPFVLTKKAKSKSCSPQIIADTTLPSLNSFSEMLKQYVEKLDEVERESIHDSVTPPTTEHSGDDDAAGVGVDGKRARPKRGQYRKYDKGALEKAVASVRSGEMSVHRAGSFYGVPHSTLEYKVKERNLLRHKNRRAEGSKAEDINCTTPTTLTHKNDTSHQSSVDSMDVGAGVLLEDQASGLENEGIREDDASSAAVAEVVEAVGSGAFVA